MAKVTNYRPITVDEVKENIYKAGQFQAQIRQVVVTDYTSTIGNSNSDLLFEAEDFDLEVSQSYESTRVTWIPVPAGKSVQDIQRLLASKPNARIYRIISHNIEDVLTEEQVAGIELGYQTLEDYQLKLEVKDSNGNPLDGPAQYKQHFFSLTAKEDVDMRERAIVRELADTQPASERTGMAA